MRLRHLVPKFIRLSLLRARVKEQCPKCTPDGHWTFWCVDVRVKRKFDIWTGKSTQVGLATIEISQSKLGQPKGSLVYNFNRATKVLKKVPNCYWY